MHVIYFVEGATDRVGNFDARGVRFVPIAGGPDDCDPKVSCFHLAPGSRIAETPCVNDSALLVVQGRVTLCGDARIEMSGGMGAVLSAGEPVRLESDDGAIVVVLEAPQLTATFRGRSTPDRIMGQRWPGEQPSRRTLGSTIRSIYYRIRWWRLGLLRLRGRRGLYAENRDKVHGAGFAHSVQDSSCPKTPQRIAPKLKAEPPPKRFRYAVATGRALRDPTQDLRGALAPLVATHHAGITEPRRVGELLRALHA